MPPGHVMALAACHVLCWPAMPIAMPIAMALGIAIAIAMALVLALSMSLGLAHYRWPPIAKYHDCGPALLSRHLTRATWFGLVRFMPFHALQWRLALPGRAFLGV